MTISSQPLKVYKFRFSFLFNPSYIITYWVNDAIDRTVKVWDLHSGVEIQSLERHPNNVVAVKYSPETGLVFTASSAYVKVITKLFTDNSQEKTRKMLPFKVWDLRQSPSRCIKTLSSSGWPASGNQANTTSTRSLQLPHGIAAVAFVLSF